MAFDDLQLSRHFDDLRFMNAAKRSVTTSSRSSQALFRSASRQSSSSNLAPSPSVVNSPPVQRSAYRPKRAAHQGARQAILFESSVKLTVNLLLAIVATTTIAKLVPYYQAHQQRLTTLQAAVAVAEHKNAELRSQFTNNFDPAQASRIMQEQSGLGYPNQKRVIWESPLDRH